MHARGIPCATLLLLALVASPVHATTAVVPDSFPTVQAGIDSGRDTVLVRGGRYDENLTSDRGFALLAYPASLSYGMTVLPQVGGLAVHRAWSTSESPYLLVRGVRFRGRVDVVWNLPNQDQLTFETCRVDSGLSIMNGSVNVSGCTILGDMSVSSTSAHITLNSVYGGGIDVCGDADYTIRGNYVHGPAPFGIEGSDMGLGPALLGIGGGDMGLGYCSSIEGNTVVATEIGISPQGSGYTWVADNEVLDCSGSAFVGVRGTYERNKVARCGGTRSLYGILCKRLTG